MLQGNKPIGTVAYMGGVLALPEAFCWSWGQMIQCNAELLCNPGQYVHYDHTNVSFHAAARNFLADRIQGDWLLMLDTDHRFDPDIAVRLVDRMNYYNLDVVTGVYQNRYSPHNPVLYLNNESSGETAFAPLGDWDRKTSLINIASAGAGCLLVRKTVFDRIRNDLKCSPFDIIHPYGEDHSFFIRLKKLGIKAWADMRVECNHLALKSISLEDYDVNSVQIKEYDPIQAYRA